MTRARSWRSSLALATSCGCAVLAALGAATEAPPPDRVDFLIASGEKAAAAKLVAEHVAARPDDEKARLLLGQLQLALLDPAGAIATLRAGSADGADRLAAGALLAEASLLQGRLAEAAGYYTDLIEHVGPDERAIRARASVENEIALARQMKHRRRQLGWAIGATIAVYAVLFVVALQRLGRAPSADLRVDLERGPSARRT